MWFDLSETAVLDAVLVRVGIIAKNGANSVADLDLVDGCSGRRRPIWIRGVSRTE